LARFRRERLPARASIEDGGLSFHRHYVGSTACLPSRTTLFTGQYPSLSPPDDSVPEIPEAPSQSDSFAGRPACHEQWKSLWPAMLYDQEPDGEYRRLYHFLHVAVDRAIGRVLEALDDHGMADDTIIVFTSDHGVLLGSHVDDWYVDRGVAPSPFAGPAAESFLELHNVTRDPEERTNIAVSHVDEVAQTRVILDAQRDAKRLLPSHRNA
jgi:arylsulfatase A-like enzyme